MHSSSLTQFEHLPIKTALRAGISMQEVVGILQSSGIGYHEALREFRKRWIVRVLDLCKGNQSDAAQIIGVHRNTLADWMEELKISRRYADPLKLRGARNKLAGARRQGPAQLTGNGELRLVNSTGKEIAEKNRQSPERRQLFHSSDVMGPQGAPASGECNSLSDRQEGGEL